MVRQTVKTEIIDKVLKEYGFSITKDQVVINGTGLWHIPGPDTDAGLTGRKIVVDGYGGYARVGGGAFSGKDPSKVDRSGAYAARYIAKNVVASGLADRCEVALAYVIGQPQPQMKAFDCFGTETVEIGVIDKFVDELLDTSVSGIISGLDLRRPIYSQTTAYGHFGKKELPWESIKMSK
jgi:S-adenosylmethionine synthetase